MSCAAFEYSANGRRGIGVNQPQSGLDYPFVQPSSDIQYLVADFYFEYVDMPQLIAHPLRLAWLYGVGCQETAQPADVPTPTHAADILLVDAANAPVFNSTQTGTVFSVRDWGATGNGAYDYRIFEWRQATKICRLVAYKTWPADDTLDDDYVRDYPEHIKPENAVLDERAIYKSPKYVSSLILPALNANNKLRPNVEFVAGRNVALPTAETALLGLRKNNQITINIIPGAGTGKYSDCEDLPLPGGCGCQTPITTINGVSGPDVLIKATDCLWMRTPGAVVADKFQVSSASQQQIGSNCQACCTCDDYVDIARYMNLTRDRYKNIGGLTDTVLTKHTDNIERWQAQRACRTTQPIKACMTAQRCPYIDVVVQYCNVCYEQTCAENVVIVMDFTADNNTAEPACGYTTITTAKTGTVPARLGGGWPRFTAALGDIPAGNSANVAFRLEFQQAKPTTVGLAATGTTLAGPVLAGCNNSVPPASATVSRSLYCGLDGKTVKPC